jgi:DNA-binding CsgD family transcriptional regulator
MNDMASQSPSAAEFDFLTAKQKAALDLLANHRTSKEIAHALGVSETSVNRRIEVVKLRLGGITRQELARRYNLWLATYPVSDPTSDSETAENSQSPCVETTGDILQLAEQSEPGERRDQDSAVSETAFEDPVAMSIAAPWKEWSEPRIVPRVLDGDNATLTRGAAIAILLLAIVASIVVALAAAKALADAVS